MIHMDCKFHTNWQSVRFIQIVSPYDSYELLIRMKLTNCQSIWIIRIANLYNSNGIQSICLLLIHTYWSCRRKKLTSSVVASQHPPQWQPRIANKPLWQCASTKPPTTQKGGAEPKENENEWCMKKKRINKRRRKS